MCTKLYRGCSHAYSKAISIHRVEVQSGRSLCHSSDKLLTQTYLSKRRGERVGEGCLLVQVTEKHRRRLLQKSLDSGAVSLHLLAQFYFLFASHSDPDLYPVCSAAPLSRRCFSLPAAPANSQTWLLGLWSNHGPGGQDMWSASPSPEHGERGSPKGTQRSSHPPKKGKWMPGRNNKWPQRQETKLEYTSSILSILLKLHSFVSWGFN